MLNSPMNPELQAPLDRISSLETSLASANTKIASVEELVNAEADARIAKDTDLQNQINGLMFTRVYLGSYNNNDNTNANIKSLAGYRAFEVLFTGASSRKISTGLVPNITGVYFSCYYPNVGGIRGYKASDTQFHIDDVDGSKDWELFGIK